MFQTLPPSKIHLVIVLLVVLGVCSRSSAISTGSNRNGQVSEDTERNLVESVRDTQFTTETSSSLSENQPAGPTVNTDTKHPPDITYADQNTKGPTSSLCPDGKLCSPNAIISSMKNKMAKVARYDEKSGKNEQLRKTLSDEDIAELLSDPHLDISEPSEQQRYFSNDNINNYNNQQGWNFGSSPQQPHENYFSGPSQNAPYSAQFQTGVYQNRKQRTLRSGADGSGLGADYGQMASGGTDVVINLLAEVSGLQNMVKELVGALQGNMQGVGTEFTNIHKQALDLQTKFQTAFNDLNTTVRGIYSQVSADVAGLRADVYRLHAALQGATPTGQRLIVQPDRLDPSRPKAIGVDCASLYRAGARESGVYMLQPDPADNTTKMAAYCDMKTAGGGWTVIQRRVDGSEDFFRSWRSYKMGFGSLLHDYWLGLDSIHRLTNFGNTHLRIELHDWENQTRVAEYRYVRVMDESDGYRILAGSASGDAGDPFHSVAYTSRLQSMRFSTFDVDNDLNTGMNCAKTFTSGWWFNSCFSVNLNGVWYGSASYVGPSMNGVVWDLWDHHSKGYSLKATEMKLRTEDF